MRFGLSSLQLITTALAVFTTPLVFAADCYQKLGGCSGCESKEQINIARDRVCRSELWRNENAIIWGQATIALRGHFPDQQSCVDGFNEIIGQCYGNKDGGKYDRDFGGFSAHLDVSFCNCR